MLYDGSAEAQAILKNAYETAVISDAMMVVAHAWDYLKGMDISNMLKFSTYFFEEPDYTFPNKPCVPTKVAVFKAKDNNEPATTA